MPLPFVQNKATCIDACDQHGLACVSKVSRLIAMPNQTTQASLEDRMQEAADNDIFNVFPGWPGFCASWESAGWSPLPFYKTGNGKCTSSGLSNQPPYEYGYRCNCHARTLKWGLSGTTPPPACARD